MKLDTNAVKEILKDFPPINGYLPLPRARGDNSKNSKKKNYRDQKIFAKTTGPIQPKSTKSNLGLIN